MSEDAFRGLLYPLADHLAMRLVLHFTAGKDRPSIKGYQDMQLPLTDDLTVPMRTKVVASSINLDEAWVLLHVIGNLSVLMCHHKPESLLTLWVVDLEKSGIGDPKNAFVIDGWKFDELQSGALVNVVKGTVAVYSKPVLNGKWERVNGAAVVDGGIGGRPEEGHRVDDQSRGTAAPSS